MKELLNAIRNSHDTIFKAFIAIVSLVAIVYIFPREVKFKYEFQKGKPWLHENLIAPFDFPIYKSEKELEEDREKARQSVNPVFRVQEDVIEEQHVKFENHFANEWPSSSIHNESGSFLRRLFGNTATLDSAKAMHKKAGNTILSEIQNQHIIGQTEVLSGKGGDFEIHVLRGNLSETYRLSELFTLQEAHEFAESRLNTFENIDKEVMIRVIDRCLSPTLEYDMEFTKKLVDEKLSSISPTRGVVLKDEKIIDRGQVVTDELYQKLVSLRKEYEAEMGGSQNYYLVWAGEFVLVGITLLVLIFFLALFRKDVINVNNRITFIFLVFTLTIYMASISFYFPQVNIYVLPFCILPMLIRTFLDERLATFTYTLAVILMGFFAPNPFEFVFIQLVTGALVVLYLVSIRKRSQLLLASVVTFITYSVTYIGFGVLQEGNLQNIEWMNLAWFAGSAVMVMLVYPLIFVFEKLFGFLSDITLMELSDTNNPLLRNLATSAPGTFQHSLQVANLAESACNEVGGDPMLVRTGALYHDIGKMERPQFFIENQVSGVNPHDELGYEESARIIIDHVINGIEMAKKQNLPDIIIDFIRTHHGTTMTRYFYNSYKNENPDKGIDVKKFTYPGPIPYSKETAILMMADSVEAASRSLKKYNQETISNLVDNIIKTQADEEQFVNADITFKDISSIKKLFKKMLQNIYHVRIEYPKG